MPKVELENEEINLMLQLIASGWDKGGYRTEKTGESAKALRKKLEPLYKAPRVLAKMLENREQK